ncbi:hypothetical protein BC749_103388 [Flavobacterium araucananum]|nr:hypothetical protein BC749_103388 [Flavobacterium araucananum]
MNYKIVYFQFIIVLSLLFCKITMLKNYIALELSNIIK